VRPITSFGSAFHVADRAALTLLQSYKFQFFHGPGCVWVRGSNASFSGEMTNPSCGSVQTSLKLSDVSGRVAGPLLRPLPDLERKRLSIIQSGSMSGSSISERRRISSAVAREKTTPAD
jgi:hypothetical protein